MDSEELKIIDYLDSKGFEVIGGGFDYGRNMQILIIRHDGHTHTIGRDFILNYDFDCKYNSIYGIYAIIYHYYSE
jgi:hypothetical protein